MKSTTAMSLFLLGAAVQASPLSSRQSLGWTVTDFSVESVDNGPTDYRLQLSGEGKQVTCATSNCVPSTVCPGANGPAPFSGTTCGGDVNTFFEWQFENSTSPVANGGEAFFIKFTYNKPGQDPIYGCSPEFLASNTSCVGPPGKGEILHVPSSFTVSSAFQGQCIYA